MLKKYELIDDNYVISILRIGTEEYNGICTSVDSWYSNGIPSDEKFFSHSWVKWDSCSHHSLYGEDYYGKDSEKDSYYHICGVNDYILTMKKLWFIHECYMLNHDHRLEDEERVLLNKNDLFKDMIIKEVEWTDDDYDFIKTYVKQED